MATTHLVLPWPPVTGNNQYVGTGRNKILKACVQTYRTDVWLLWIQAGSPHHAGPVSIHWLITQPTRREVDFDGLSKVIMDALQPPKPTARIDRARLLPNDSMAVIHRQEMQYLGVDRKKPRVEITIRDLEDV